MSRASVTKELTEFMLDSIGKSPSECDPFHSEKLSGEALRDIVGHEFDPVSRSFILHRGDEVPDGTGLAIIGDREAFKKSQQ